MSGDVAACECRLLPCHESNWLRMLTVAVIRAAKQCSANEALQGWCAALAGMSGCSCVRMQAAAMPREQPAANAACCRARASEALQRKRSPSGLVCSACRDERDAAECECRLAAMQATGCECRLLPYHESNRLRMQAVAVIRTSKSNAAQMEPEGRSAAPGKCSWLRRQACCTGGNRLRMQAVAVPQRAKALL